MEAACTLCATESTESAKSSSASERVSTRTAAASCAWVEAAIGVECRGAVGIVGLLLVGVGEDFVGGLGGGELFFRGGFLVSIGVVFLCEAVVCLLDVGGGGVFIDAEGFVWIGYCGGR